MGACGSKKDTNKKQPEKKGIEKAHFVIKHSKEIFQDYSIGRRLGKGSFGEVREAIQKTTNAKRAVKILKKRVLESEEMLKQMLQDELSILKKMTHPHIMEIYECYEDPYSIYIVTELLEGGELFDKICEETSFGEKRAADIMKQLLGALTYCHQNGVAHRDLKPENLMLESKATSKEGEWFVKLVDFGFAKFYNPNKRFSELLGSPMYIAPEILNKNYDPKCDIWSSGIILFIMLTGRMPFEARSQQELFDKIRAANFSMENLENTPYLKHVSKEGKEFLAKMLIKEPSERPSAEELLTNIWIQKEAPNAAIDENTKASIRDNLLQYKTNMKFQQAVLTYMATHLTQKKDVEDLRKAFEALDTTKDGFISREELRNGTIASPEEVEEMLNRLDANKDGKIDYSEFLAATLDQEKVANEKNLKAAFQVFDKDGNGYITKGELESLFTTEMGDPGLVRKMAEEMISEGDTDKDQKISFEEFRAMMEKVTEESRKEQYPTEPAKITEEQKIDSEDRE